LSLEALVVDVAVGDLRIIYTRTANDIIVDIDAVLVSASAFRLFVSLATHGEVNVNEGEKWYLPDFSMRTTTILFTMIPLFHVLSLKE
jgi:hypothetical protein